MLIAKDHTEDAVVFVDDTGGEIDEAIVLEQSPQAIKLEWDIENVFRSADKAAVPWIINVNTAVAEIAHPELSIHNLESPRRIEISMRHQAPE